MKSFALPGRRMNTSRGWEIYPQIMYDMAMRLKSEYGNIPWFIAESGMGIEQEERFADSEGHHSGRLPHRLHHRALEFLVGCSQRRRELQRLHAVGLH
jgi:hypothetical protein